MDNLIGWSYLTVPDQCDQISVGGGSDDKRGTLKPQLSKDGKKKPAARSRRKVPASSVPPLLFKYLP